MKIRNKLKSGNALVIALLVALVIGLIVALTITIVTLMKINNSNSEKNPNNNINNGIIDNTGKEEGKLPEQQPSDADKDEVDEQVKNSFEYKLTNYIVNSIKTYAKAGKILKSTDGDVSAAKLTEKEVQNSAASYTKKITAMLSDKTIFSSKFTKDGNDAVLYNFEKILNKLGLSSHMGSGIGCYDSNGNKIYEYGKTEIETYAPNNTNIVKYFGYTTDLVANTIANQIEAYAKGNYLLKSTDGDVSAPKLTLAEAKNNRTNYKKAITENLDDRDVFPAIYFENGELVVKCYIEDLLNKLGVGSHMGAGLDIDKNGIQIFSLK